MTTLRILLLSHCSRIIFSVTVVVKKKKYFKNAMISKVAILEMMGIILLFENVKSEGGASK